jgi:hypothetical protein
MYLLVYFNPEAVESMQISMHINLLKAGPSGHAV